MNIRIVFLTYLLLYFTVNIVSAQVKLSREQDTLKLKKISWQKLKLYFDDDYLNIAGKGTDQYYTAGWQFDAYYKRNIRGRSVFDRLLMSLPHGQDNYYYGMCRRIYTPADLIQPQIIYGDRPYASVITIQHGMVSTDPDSKESISTDIGAGAIGPITYGGQIQTWFHKIIGDQQPMGWKNQIRNNVVLDYNLNYARQILKPSPNLELLANVDCEAGTLVDNMGIGFTMSFGNLNGHLLKENQLLVENEKQSGKVAIHAYMHPTVRAVIYNATLEGGFFSNMDPYVISRSDINVVYLQYDFGFVLQAGRFGISLAEKLRTAEFRYGQTQEVGNITMFIPM